MDANILFIGLGAMGGQMARRLAESGRPLVVHDSDPLRCSELAGLPNLRVSEDILWEAARADIIFLMLPNSRVVEKVLLEHPNGLLAAARPGCIIIDMGSSEPASTVELAQRATTHHCRLVDAPVSGGVGRASSGELTVMMGGTDDDAAVVIPLLESLASQLFRTGAVGSGHAMKALNNLLSAIGLVAAAEVLCIGASAGLEPELMLEVLNASTGRNHATETKFRPHILSGSFASGFGMDLMVKDMRIAQDLALKGAVSSPVADAAAEAWRSALAHFGQRRPDHTEIARYVETISGVQLHSGS